MVHCSPCRALPHGWYSVFVAILATVAWLSSWVQETCNFAIVTGPIVAELDPTFTSQAIPFLEFGLSAFREPAVDQFGNYTVSLRGSCTEYPDGQLIDSIWNTSRFFAFLALVLGGGSSLFVWCSTCFVFSRATWRWTGYCLVLASLCQATVFLWFMTQLCSWNACTLSDGSKADLLAVVLLMLSACLMFIKYPTPAIRELIPREDDEESEQKEHHSKQINRKDGIMMMMTSTTTATRPYGHPASQDLQLEEEEPDVVIEDSNNSIQQRSGESTTEMV
ncbi:hypothetical protein IV203_032197 [Nitzschia inconspicua]|uniref:Uncharacterized protein n=1 Tax=Nitzschia inconspicua TaxID=303405 RepID=A0A9K3P816_9STRA|nr:hypothetical protein IV203_033494 [Nitzschia inconspicua]KAG7337046.1 hypothetical protein IV203_022810 [Nitzschia inconspicua]KAG7344666.1 hypothetical protein IV203_032197 [Nitzschia inconspicua]